MLLKPSASPALLLLLSFLLLALERSVCSAHGGHHHHHHHDHDDHDHDHPTEDQQQDQHATWGANIAWRSLAEGKAEAAATGKPLMLLVWKTWCGACKALRPKFASSAAIASEASKFVMVNVVDDEEPSDAIYKPEGAGYSEWGCAARPGQCTVLSVARDHCPALPAVQPRQTPPKAVLSKHPHPHPTPMHHC